MSRRRFAVVVVCWLLAIVLCSTDLGALVGFMTGVAVSMYGAALDSPSNRPPRSLE